VSDVPLRHLATVLLNRPVLLAPEAAETIAAYLIGRLRMGNGWGADAPAGETYEVFQPTRTEAGGTEVHTPRLSRFRGSTPIGADGRPQPFQRTETGTAVISVVGEAINRGGWLGAQAGMVAYEAIRYQMRAAAADPLTRSIIVDISSRGGEAVGAFEAAAAVRAAAAVKPVVAVVDGVATSGAFALASGASRVVVIPSGQVGGIGVAWCHVDLSQAMAAAGIKPTIIHAGRHKVDGHPFAPLPAAVRQDVQARLDAFYRQFCECVAKGRGTRLAADAARKTEARVYTGAEAVRVGLADATGTFEDVLAELSERRRPLAVGTSSTTTGAVTMNAPPKIASDLGAPEPRASDRDGNDVVTAPPPPGAPALPPSITALVAVREQRVGAPSGGLVAAAKRQAAATTGAAPSSADQLPARPGSLLAAARRQAAATLAKGDVPKAGATACPSIADAARRQAGSAAKRPPDQHFDLA
jgi:signal peptide peptidase SppA